VSSVFGIRGSYFHVALYLWITIVLPSTSTVESIRLYNQLERKTRKTILHHQRQGQVLGKPCRLHIGGAVSMRCA
jgi:hypothetical protein